ncbi:hypothetical protein [Microbacterium lacticum]
MVILLLLVGATSGCTPSDNERSEPTQSSSAWSPSATAVQLGCEDGLTGPDLLTDETKLTDTVGSALLEQLSRLPQANDVGIPAPSEDWYFRKAPLFVAPGTPAVTLSLPEDGSQYLMWTSDDAWTGSAGEGISSAWAATELSITACPDLTTSYFGGLLVKDPSQCFPLEVRQEDQIEVLSIRGDGAACA